MKDDSRKNNYKRKIRIIATLVLLAGAVWYVVWFFTPSPNELSVRESTRIINIIDKHDLKSLNSELDHGLNPNAILCNRTTCSLIRNGSSSSDILEPLISYACSEGTSEMVKTLVDRGAKVNNPYGDNAPLLCAADSLNFSMIKTLLEHGAKVNQKDSMEETALMLIAEDSDTGSRAVNRTNICKLLLKYGATVNDVNFQGETALSRFVESSIHDSNFEIIKLLIKSKANPNIKDIDGNNLIQEAKFGKNPKIIACLKIAMEQK